MKRVLAVLVLLGALVPSVASAAPRDVCGPAAPGFARCYAKVDSRSALRATGYSPADLRSAYRLPDTGGAAETIAIVDAGDAPTAEADLAVYRQTYGLPPCTTANGCFRKVNQNGDATPLPPRQGDWPVETALDLDMASAACSQCKILLVEGDDASFEALGASVDTAVKLGATIVSNSYGAPESHWSAEFAAHYQHPGVAIVASSGDGGFDAPSAPAVYASVIAVGGTSLSKADNERGWTESVWTGASSGCSAWVAKPSWQKDPNCPGRTVADVAAVADPATGPAVYETTVLSGWRVVGGTSASAPLIAGVIALAGHHDRYPDASRLYSGQLNDVVSGNNVGFEDCGGDYLCTGVPGYDGPTGNGTPDGLAAF
ncbi:S8 family serine peptidase [Amycolatopsis sp. FU40]|uniref:S53 family peptidase n=1 Tax=Amycolatopsis sp. FU40 TaxID=2914159 RepID=UPI001F02FB26|nr:S8 family serine peptidase [Amycolatopsis sp. FU40]UKD55486.1 S8 family serine peptidase [Amycolatopsis sp. FU40]